MALQDNRPVPKRRSVHLGSNTNNEISTTDLYGTAQDVQTKTLTGPSGLPSCVRLKSDVSSADQKSRDSTLPQLLYDLDMACNKDSNDDEKSRLANACLLAASFPIRKYRILKFFLLLENNKTDIRALPGALSILEKYAINLLRDEKPQQWKEIKLSTSIIRNMVIPVNGALDVLKQMGYTEDTGKALTFPMNVHQPNIERTVVLTADLSIARHETDALLNNRHPFLEFNPAGFGSMSERDMPDITSDEGGFCGVCSEQNLAKKCDECDMQFCLDCDERWHCHKLRRNHIRTSLLANKNKDQTQRRRPVPVPRKRQNQKAGDNLRSSQNFQEPTGNINELGRTTSFVASNMEDRSPGNQEIKRPPLMSRDDRRLSNDMTSPDNMLGGNMNIHMNPSQQNQRLNELYGVYAPQTGIPYSGHDQGFHQSGLGALYQSGNRAQDFNQSGSYAQGFNQSESTNQGFNQYGRSAQDFTPSRSEPSDNQQSGNSAPNKKVLHRVRSCPSCSLLYPENQESCPSCHGNLSPTRQQHMLQTAEKQQNFTSGISDQKTLLKDMANTPNAMATRALPDPPCFQSMAVRDNRMDNREYEAVDDMLEWSCEHCTFVNPLTTKVCQACFKTPADLKKFPNLVEKSSPAKSMTPPNVPQTRPYGAMGSPNVPQTGAYEAMTSPNVPLTRAHGTMGSPNVPHTEAYEAMASPNVPPTGAFGVQGGRPSDRRAVYMTPKDQPLEGGIFMTPGEGNAPPLPAKKQFETDNSPGGKILDAQKHREQQLSEKEKGKLLYEKKKELWKDGFITEDELYTINNPDELQELVEARKRNMKPDAYPMAGYSNRANYPGRSDDDINQQQLMQLLQSGVISQQDVINDEKALRNLDMNKQTQLQDSAVFNEPRRNETLGNQEDISLSEQQLQQLLEAGEFGDDINPPEQFNPAFGQYNQGNFGTPPHRQFGLGSPGMRLPQHYNQGNFGNQPSQITREELTELYKAGIITLDYLQNPPLEQIYDVPKHDPPAATSDIQQMFAEYQRLQLNEQAPDTKECNYGNMNPTFQQFNVTQEAPVVPGIYEKLSTMYASMPVKGSKDNFSSYLNSQKPSEHVHRRNFIDDQSRLYVEWIKEAEMAGFTAEELNLANNLNWQDSKGRSPVQWLKDEWGDRIAEVIGRVTEQTSNENDRIGNLSTEEAKQALLENHGSVESACKACIESRREKLEKMGDSSFFTRVDCVNALDRNDGNLEDALLELEMKALEPIRKRVVRQVDQEDFGARSRSLNQAYEQVVKNKHVSVERRIRLVLIEHNMKSWGRAEVAIKLIDMGYNVEDSIEAAIAVGDLGRCLVYLQQECPICFDKKPMSQMITFLSCQDKICMDCVRDYLTGRIKEMQIHQIVCPVCGLPDINDEAAAAEYLNNLDIMIRALVDSETHDLFQKKLRDRVLSKEANFRWCAHCSSGFINELPNVNKMQCPHCLHFTCFTCKKQWEDQHEGITCEQFARWKEENDEEYQQAGLAGHLARNGIDCPECKFRYDLARGGCMHFKCGQCGHEFCSGCNNPMKHGARCNLFQSCAGKGLHAHHPRGCLFYLRDWEPERLQELLQENNVDYKAGEEGLGLQDDDDDDDEIVGAVGGGQNCKVMEQKEAGINDVECGRACYPGHNGLCRLHYTEYLVDLINKNGLDPADKMTIDEMHIVFRRSEVEYPAQVAGESNDDYQERLLDVLKQQVPLPQPPGLQAAVVVNQEEAE